MACCRFILLGASNVALAFPRIVHGLSGSLSQPAEVFAAFGHGRSYGLESRVLGRRLSGVRDCGLWAALEKQPPMPAHALLTDIGNDLLYGVPVTTIVGWAEDCARRLEAVGARSTLTMPPAASVAGLARWRYLLLRQLLFPKNRDSLDLTRRRLEDLRRRLHGLAQRFGLRLVEPRAGWFGIDPIHIRPRAQGRAWGEILGDWPLPADLPRPPWSSARRIWRLAPAERRLWGRVRRCPQPHGMPGGMKIHLF